MFPGDVKTNRHTYVFIAAFHLGVPLGICHTDKSVGWTEIRQEFLERLSKYPDRFEITPVNYDAEVNFPLGDPLIFKSVNFLDIFDLPRFFHEVEFSIPTHPYKLDNMVWICPSGAVFISAKVSLDTVNCISYADFTSKIVEEHYAELGYLFSEISEILLPAIPQDLLDSFLCCPSDIAKQKEIIKLRNLDGFRRADIFSNNRKLTDFLEHNREAKALYEDILIDIYYIDFLAPESKKPRMLAKQTASAPKRKKSETLVSSTDPRDLEKFRIDYDDSSVISDDLSYIFYIHIAFSTFIGLLWLVKHLGEGLRRLHNIFIGQSPLKKGISSELKLLRIFCLQFINESNPISIRLTRRYMECIETYWEATRQSLLVNQINEQLAALEEMVDWIEGFEREARNFKVGVAATLLAVISITAVVAQLVSTIDVDSQLSGIERGYFILIGLMIGILCTLGIYMLPFTKWYLQYKDKRHTGKTQKKL
ncbi:MAG: hypothetical protein WA821_16390 [Anaerolineales bacterium]